MSDKTCDYSINGGGTATITLNRPKVHNAFDRAMIDALIGIFSELDQLPSVRTVVLTSGGKHFCAGMDLLWLQRTAANSRTENEQDALKLTDLMHTVYCLSKPTIALIRGAAYGGGAGLVSCCDVALASEDARFCFSEARLGLIPAVISPYVVRAIGRRYARRYFMTSEVFGADEACRIGLVHEVLGNNELAEKADEIIDALKRGSPSALRACKNLLKDISSCPIDESTKQKTAQWFAKIRGSEDAKEGVAAFLEKRKPSWLS